MKILLVNITGRIGSTGKIVSDLKSYFDKNGHHTIIAYGHSDFVDSEGYIKVSNTLEARLTSQLCKLGRPIYKGNPFSLQRLKRLIEKEIPDIVNLHCINGFDFDIYAICDYLSKFCQSGHLIPTIITHHAEFFYTGSCAYSLECSKFSTDMCRGCINPQKAAFSRILPNPYANWKRMNKAIHQFKKDKLTFASVSPWVHNRAATSPIVNEYRDITILNGIDTDIFHYRGTKIFQHQHFDKAPDIQRVAIHVTSNFSCSQNDIKGGRFIIEIARLMPNIQFVIISPNSPKIQDLPINVKFYGMCENQIKLAEMYSLADFTLLTSQKETFSMVVAESLCCGTPVVGFKAGGPESIAMKEYSYFTEYGDIPAIVGKIEALLHLNFNKKIISQAAQKVYSKERMGAEYLRLYSEMTSH